MSFNEQDDPDNPWAAPKNEPTKSSTKRPKKEKDEPVPITQVRRNKNSEGKSSGNLVDDLFDLLQEGVRKKGNGGGNKQGPSAPKLNKGVFFIGAIVCAVLWLGSGFFRVQEGELAAVLRFGKMVRISQPGLQYRLPAPFEREIIRKVDVLNKIDSVLKQEKGQQSENQEQSLILTGDENMVYTNYTVLWKIRDLGEFLFTARDPEATIRVAAESAMREVLGQTTARLALTDGRGTIGTKAQELLQKILDVYKLGVQIVSVQLQRVEPPVQVIQAFNDMQASLVDGDRLRNEAEAYHSDILPRARGEAEKIIQDAEAYRQEVVAKAEGEANRFNAIYTSYRLNPKVTIMRHYFDTIEKVLKKNPKTIVDSKIGAGVMPYLNLQNGKKTNKAEKAE